MPNREMIDQKPCDVLAWKTRDGLRLHGSTWCSEIETSAVICLVHGLGEHSGRYAHVSAFLNRAGYTVAAFDLRGHGRSEGPRGHAFCYETLMDDIADFVAIVRARHLETPLFLYGHSFGGNLVLNFALRRRPDVCGVIATAPGLQPAFEVPSWKKNLGGFLSHLWPSYSMPNGLEVKALARDPEVVEAYRGDPLVHEQISIRLAFNLLEAGSWALKHASEFPCGLLLMHGSRDRIASYEASREFGRRAGACCNLKIWDGLYHEIHNEPEQERVLRYMCDWLTRYE